MKNKTTLYHFIIDKSGSMCDCIDDTVAGFNHQLSVLKDLEKEHPDMEFLCSISLFNTEVDNVISMQKPRQANKLTATNYVPSGGTALYDAIGLSLQRIERVIGAEIEKDEASVVVLIITDGYENSSRMFSHREIGEMVKRLEKTEKWTFNFLGADIDASSSAEQVSINSSHSISFQKENYSNAMIDLDASMRSYASEKAQGRVKQNLFDIFKTNNNKGSE